MPALDVLSSMDSDWKAEFETALPRARRMAQILPLVRVFIPHNEPRLTDELHDLLIDGDLKRSHKSGDSSKKEIRLQVRDSLYFHAGRTHPDYGHAVLVFKDLRGAVEVTPFGIGGLDCPSYGPDHAAGKCVSPIAHIELSKQSDFVHDSTWAEKWRDRASEFLAAFFGDRLDKYFYPEDSGRPTRPDPERIFVAPDNRDWRSWTIELRKLDDLHVRAALQADLILIWALDEHVENLIDETVQDTGTPKTDLFPFLTELPEHLRLDRTATDAKSLFAAVDATVKALVLS